MEGRGTPRQCDRWASPGRNQAGTRRDISCTCLKDYVLVSVAECRAKRVGGVGRARPVRSLQVFQRFELEGKITELLKLLETIGLSFGLNRQKKHNQTKVDTFGQSG